MPIGIICQAQIAWIKWRVIIPPSQFRLSFNTSIDPGISSAITGLLIVMNNVYYEITDHKLLIKRTDSKIENIPIRSCLFLIGNQQCYSRLNFIINKLPPPGLLSIILNFKSSPLATMP